MRRRDANANEYGQAVYFTVVKIDGANGWRDFDRNGVGIYDASLVECVSAMDMPETKGGAK